MNNKLETTLATAGATAGLGVANFLRSVADVSKKVANFTAKTVKNGTAYVVATGKTIGQTTVKTFKVLGETAKQNYEVAKAKQR